GNEKTFGVHIGAQIIGRPLRLDEEMAEYWSRAPKHASSGALARSVQGITSWTGASSSSSARCSSSRHFTSGHQTANGGSAKRSRSGSRSKRDGVGTGDFAELSN